MRVLLVEDELFIRPIAMEALGDAGEQLRAVVVRFVEPRADARLQQAHPLTEPAVRPLTMYRCRNRKSAVTGIRAISDPAANGPQCWP